MSLIWKWTFIIYFLDVFIVFISYITSYYTVLPYCLKKHKLIPKEKHSSNKRMFSVKLDDLWGHESGGCSRGCTFTWLQGAFHFTSPSPIHQSITKLNLQQSDQTHLKRSKTRAVAPLQERRVYGPKLGSKARDQGWAHTERPMRYKSSLVAKGKQPPQDVNENLYTDWAFHYKTTLIQLHCL